MLYMFLILCYLYIAYSLRQCPILNYIQKSNCRRACRGVNARRGEMRLPRVYPRRACLGVKGIKTIKSLGELVLVHETASPGLATVDQTRARDLLSYAHGICVGEEETHRPMPTLSRASG